MRVENNNKAFAYRVPIGDYNYLQCTIHHHEQNMKNPEPDFYACLSFDCFLKNELHVFANIIMQRMQLSEVTFIQESFVFKIYNLLFQVWSYSYSEHRCSLTKLQCVPKKVSQGMGHPFDYWVK